MSTVSIDKKALEQVIAYISTAVDLDKLKSTWRKLVALIRGNPFDSLTELKQTGEALATLVIGLMAAAEVAVAAIKEANPDTQAGQLKLEAVTRVLDDVIDIGGPFGVIAERFDDDAIRVALTLLVGMLNKLVAKGESWVDLLPEDMKPQPAPGH